MQVYVNMPPQQKIGRNMTPVTSNRQAGTQKQQRSLKRFKEYVRKWKDNLLSYAVYIIPTLWPYNTFPSQRPEMEFMKVRFLMTLSEVSTLVVAFLQNAIQEHTWVFFTGWLFCMDL